MDDFWDNICGDCEYFEKNFCHVDNCDKNKNDDVCIHFEDRHDLIFDN